MAGGNSVHKVLTGMSEVTERKWFGLETLRRKKNLWGPVIVIKVSLSSVGNFVTILFSEIHILHSQ